VAPRLALARLLVRLGRLDEAQTAYGGLLARHPEHREGLHELGWLHGNRRRFAEALSCYDKLDALGVDVTRELADIALGFAHMGDCSRRESLLARLTERVARPLPCRFNPYALLTGTDDAAIHHLAGQRIADAVREETRGLPRPSLTQARGRRLRVGYICGDLNQHATSLLLAGVIEAHDRERLRVTAYDYSEEDGSPVRARMVAAFERMVRVSGLSAAQTAARIAADGTDILVDLAGYTDRPCSQVLALRAAPVQLSFLGYVSSQGAEWIDGAITDATVVPEEEQTHWTERILHVPHCCFPSDRSRPRPAPDRDRAAHGLPENAPVFACFNSPHKIAPDMFACWMRLLHAVPGSVLWLYEGNEFIAANLRGHAQAAGIAPERLVFAPPARLEAHIARHGCADVFLDTFPYGAHTTGIDALWAGLPMITLTGRSFASRLGASMLRAVDMPGLIAETPEGYFDLALSLARDRPRLASLNSALLASRDSAPLFDAGRFARDLDALYAELVA
jgi:predicted O-linked N-acetylglucosamine transferase (SPINDLY family)